MYCRIQISIGDDAQTVALEVTAEPVTLTDCRPGAGIQYAVQQMLEGVLAAGALPALVEHYREIAMPGFGEEN